MMALMPLSACHHKEQRPAEESLPAVQEPSPVVIPDTPPTPDNVTHSATTHSKHYQLQEDTAAVTNLRLFARKQRSLYSPTLLVGEWQRDGEHEHYLADGSGNRWDTHDEIHRDEAQSFTWTMDSNMLTITYKLSFGSLVVRQYVVTFVDDETLVYRDAYGGAYMWDKVPADFTDLPTHPKTT